MKDATGPCTACERIASIEAMLDTLAERIDQDNHPNQRGIYHGEQQKRLALRQR